MTKLFILFFSVLLLFSATGIAQSRPPCTAPTTITTATSYISNVTLGFTNTTARSPAGYGHYTNLSTDVAVGSDYIISVKSSGNASYIAYWVICIDYNKNGIFGDAGEIIGSGQATAGHDTSFHFTIPATVFNGAATLKVKMTQMSAPNSNNPCTIYSDEGEQEDYSVNITGSVCFERGINSGSDYISNITVSNLSKTSGNDNGYANYTAYSANLTSGYSYPVSLSRLPSSSRIEYWTVFIDYNNNKNFADAGDMVASAKGSDISVANIKIPFLMSSATGTRRMRIIVSHDGYQTNPCSNVSNGEVEDYSVNLMPPVLGTARETNSMAFPETKDASVSVQPNPSASSHVIVHYTVTTMGNVTIHVTDLGGRSVFVSYAGSKTAGNYTYVLSSSGTLTAGIYLMTLEQNGKEIAHNKFVIAQ